jgi:Family of unknown function (DUF6524)
MRNLTLGGVLARFAASLVLVVATFNPTGYSFVHWIAANFPHLEPIQLVVGIALLGLWLFFLHATWRSLGTVGVVLGLAFLAAVVWLFASWGWFHSATHVAMIWMALVLIACLLTFGLSWALIQRRISGQVVVEDDKD